MNSFENIYRENYQKMYCIAFRMINDKDAVSDIIQDVFIYFHKISQNGNIVNKPKSWLIKATINKCIDYYKHKKNHTKIESIGPIPFIENTTERKEDKEIIRLALSKLKPGEKALALLYSEGMSYKEISEITEIKLSSVGKMLSRTLEKLDEILKKMNYEMY